MKSGFSLLFLLYSAVRTSQLQANERKMCIHVQFLCRRDIQSRVISFRMNKLPRKGHFPEKSYL